MSVEVKVPVLPESVADATIAAWHKKPGDAVRRDENLVDLETDKVVLEVPAPADGVLKQVLRQVGETVTSQEVLALIEEEAAASPRRPRRLNPRPPPPRRRIRPRSKRRCRLPLAEWPNSMGWTLRA